MKHLTDTTGIVRGIQEVKNFINMCNSKFECVDTVKVTDHNDKGYLQYTLLNDNKIRIYISA